MDMDGPDWDSHEYWKMKILSMHKNVSSGEKWVVGTWFYTPSQLRGIKLKDRYSHLRLSVFTNTYLILFIEAFTHLWETLNWSFLLIGT